MDQYRADTPISTTSAIPNPYRGTTPNVTSAGLTPYQLALADQLVKGTAPPYGVNPGFIAAMNTFASTKLLTPSTINPKTLETVQPPIAPGVSGNAYVVLGSTVYVIRQAQDCGPDDVNRYEKIAVENLANIAIRTWLYYGGSQPNGSAATGTGEGSEY